MDTHFQINLEYMYKDIPDYIDYEIHLISSLTSRNLDANYGTLL